MEKKKKINIPDSAIFAYDLSNYIPCNTTDYYNEEEVTLTYGCTQEKEVYKKDTFKKLSDEAKEIINTILDGPKEVLLNIASSSQNKINKKRVQEYFSIVFGSNRKSKLAVKEIENFVKTF